MTMARVSYEVTCVGALGPIRRRIGISRRRDTAKRRVVCSEGCQSIKRAENTCRIMNSSQQFV